MRNNHHSLDGQICFLIVMLFSLFANHALAQERVNAHNDIAMDGFDVVAYFAQNKPIKGEDQHVVKHKGKQWLFSSAENAAEFSAHPAKFEPQFNGWCAYAVSEGYSAEVDFVDGWVVLDDKLYLNWDKEVRDTFIEQQKHRKVKAAINWTAVHAGMLDGSGDFYTHEQENVDVAHPQQLAN